MLCCASFGPQPGRAQGRHRSEDGRVDRRSSRGSRGRRMRGPGGAMPKVSAAGVVRLRGVRLRRSLAAVAGADAGGVRGRNVAVASGSRLNSSACESSVHGDRDQGKRYEPRQHANNRHSAADAKSQNEPRDEQPGLPLSRVAADCRPVGFRLIEKIEIAHASPFPSCSTRQPRQAVVDDRWWGG